MTPSPSTVGTLLRNAWLIGAVTAGSVGLAAWWASREGARYRSTVRMEIEDGESGSALAAIDALAASYDRSGLEAAPDPSGGALEIRYEASDAEAARRGARTAAEAVRAAGLAAAPEEAAAALSALEAEVLDVASRALEAYAELERLRTRDLRALLEAERRTWEELLGGIARARSAGPAAVARGAAARRVPDPAIEPLRARWAAYRAQRAALVSGPAALAANHPDVQRLSTLIASSEATLEGTARGRVASLAARIEELSGPAGAVQAARDAPGDTVQVLATLAALESRAAELREEIAAARGEEAIPSVPPPPEVGEPRRLPPDPRREILIGLVVGLLLGGVAAVARGWIGSARASPLAPPAAEAVAPGAAPQPPPVSAEPTPAEVPLLAVIPLVSPTLVEPLENGDFRPGPGQVAGLAAYRELRNRLVGSRWGLKTLVVTSAHPGEGKTTTSTNLAATYARQGLKVVLIECDLRRPSLGRYFRITKQIDLMDVLFEKRDWRLALQLTRTPGLYVLLGEKSFPRAGDSLGGPEMQRLLSEITGEYDLVILDSSPLLVAADATVLGPIVDGVLLVVRATRTDRRTVASVIARLREVGATVVGMVLNDPDGAAAEWLSSASPDPPDGRTESGTPAPPPRPS